MNDIRASCQGNNVSVNIHKRPTESGGLENCDVEEEEAMSSFIIINNRIRT